MDWSNLEPYLPYAIGVAAVFVVVHLLRRLLSSGGGPEYTERRACSACGWEGSVSHYHRTCPACGARIV